MHGADLEYALGQRAGLVKHNSLDLRQSLKIVGAFDEDTFLARAADAGEEAERDADDERAGAADNEEGQRTVYPLFPLCVKSGDETDYRRQHREGERAVTNGGGIYAGELRDERLGAGFAGAGVFDKLKYLGDGGLAELLGGFDFQNAGHVYAAAYNIVAGLGVAREAFTGQCAGVERGAAFNDDTVDRNLFAWLHNDDAADNDLIGIDLFKLAVTFNVGVVGADIHKRADVLAALADGVALEQLAYLVKQHNGDSLVVVAAALIYRQRKRADRGDGHQKVLVKYAAVEYALAGLSEYIVADDDVYDQIQRQTKQAGDGDKVQRDEHYGRDDDACQHLSLLLGHYGASPL